MTGQFGRLAARSGQIPCQDPPVVAAGNHLSVRQRCQAGNSEAAAQLDGAAAGSGRIPYQDLPVIACADHSAVCEHCHVPYREAVAARFSWATMAAEYGRAPTRVAQIPYEHMPIQSSGNDPSIGQDCCLAQRAVTAAYLNRPARAGRVPHQHMPAGSARNYPPVC
jgi:hypothetical protein